MTVASYGDETAVITGYLKQNWDEATVPVAWPNTPLLKDDEGKLHIEVKIIRALVFKREIATNPRERHPGTLTFVVRSPLGAGDGSATDTGDDLCALFRNLRIEGIQFGSATMFDFGRRGGGDMHIVEVHIPFYRDSTF